MSLVFWATSRTICAPMFSNLSSSSISLATVTPILGGAGSAVGLVEDDVTALGSERYSYGVRQNVDTTQHAVARVAGKTDFLGRHFESPVM
jgi:hypothetical protein